MHRSIRFHYQDYHILHYMIRAVKSSDAEAIANIYNPCIAHTTITFETEAVSVEEMRHRIETISASFPYYVYEEDGQILGYCYAHLWKERAAYAHTLETTVYLASEAQGKGIGTLLMRHLIRECKMRGFHALIACITEGNAPSIRMHQKLGFKPVSHFEQVGNKFGKWLGVDDMELIL